MRNIELLVPASSLEVLKIAVVFGADAVYIGGEAFGLRAKAKNFTHEDMNNVPHTSRRMVFSGKKNRFIQVRSSETEPIMAITSKIR